MTHDVVVVGAGPAGSYAASLLAASGHAVALLDENPTPRERIICTGIVGAEAYERLDLPRGSVVDALSHAHFLSPSGIRVVHHRADPMAYVVDRTVFDGALTRRAVDVGVTLLRGHAARGVRKTGDHVGVRCEVGSDLREVHARVLVIATGHQRWLHEEGELGVPPDYVHGVHADVPFQGLEAAELYFGSDVAPGFFAWAVPFGPEMARLGVLSRQGSKQLFSRFIRSEPIDRRLGLSATDEETIESRVRSRAIVQGPVDPSYADRVVAVGEAAGQVKTTTGGGIYYGMMGAEVAAAVLDEGLRRDQLHAGFLERYQTRWWDRLGPEIRAGRELQRFARSLEDQEIDRLFGALSDGLGGAVRQVVEFDWHRPALEALFTRRAAWRALLEHSVPLPLMG